MTKLERYTVTMPKDLFEAFDARNAQKGYRNRSEALRDLVRDALIRDQVTNPQERAAAAITLVYDHHTRTLSDRITAIQHELGDLIIATMHVHLDHHHCLEVIVVRGSIEAIHSLADALAAIKGVKHAQLSMTSEGGHL